VITRNDHNRSSGFPCKFTKLAEAEGHYRIRGPHGVKEIASNNSDIWLQKNDTPNRFLKRKIHVSFPLIDTGFC
jgi:hypothetical protein